MTAHPWHGADHHFNASSFEVDGVVEIPRGSKAKYEVDKETGLIRLDRVIFAAFHYPINYGFIPKTLGKDGDPLDILILSEVSVVPLCLVRTRIIGMMEMTDGGTEDEKIIAVASGDMSVSHIDSVDNLPQNFQSELRHFFTEYKTLSKRTVVVDAFLPATQALQKIEDAIQRYKSTYLK
jgi:inorganic pyrophosphatase